MKLEDLRKPFHKDDLEWRIMQAGRTSSGTVWAKCVAYVSARAIQDRLDLVVGPSNWRVWFDTVPGVADVSGGILCSLAVRVGDEWISKQDGSDQSEMEKFKGGLSGALKRAAVMWGIGRYLYSLETGFAKIVERGTPGAQYAKTKEGEQFYWLPPDLPGWAQG